MFGWFKKADYYGDRQKKLFKYWNGSRVVKADPLVIYKKFLEVRPDLAVNIKLARSAHKDSNEGHDKAMAKIREVFQIPVPANELEPKGTLTHSELSGLLDSFLTYIDKLKKNSRPLVTSSTNMVTQPSSNDFQPTKNSVVSTSTAKESSSGVLAS
jgi:hypothetical protein